MLLGVHCGVRGGYLSALSRARALACEAMQMLTYPRHQDPSEAELAAFREAYSRSGLMRLVLHVRYLPFLACEEEALRARSARLLAREMRLAQGLGGDWLVLHLGAYSPGSSVERGMGLFADGVKAAAEESGSTVPLLIENIPGGGRRMGGSLEELASFREILSRRGLRAGVCIDTAHAWAYGYELDSREGMGRFLARVDRLIGAGDVPVFHVNDSRAPQGSHRENHWPWGGGCVAREALAALLERGEYRNAVGIIEAAEPAADEANLAYVRSVRGGPAEG